MAEQFSQVKKAINKVKGRSNMPFFTLGAGLQTMLIVWKLFEFAPFASWSWWMIFSPFLTSFAIIAIVCTLIIIVGGLIINLTK